MTKEEYYKKSGAVSYAIDSFKVSGSWHFSKYKISEEDILDCINNAPERKHRAYIAYGQYLHAKCRYQESIDTFCSVLNNFSEELDNRDLVDIHTCLMLSFEKCDRYIDAINSLDVLRQLTINSIKIAKAKEYKTNLGRIKADQRLAKLEFRLHFYDITKASYESKQAESVRNAPLSETDANNYEIFMSIFRIIENIDNTEEAMCYIEQLRTKINEKLGNERTTPYITKNRILLEKLDTELMLLEINKRSTHKVDEKVSSTQDGGSCNICSTIVPLVKK